MNDLKLDYSNKGKLSPQVKRLALIAGIVLLVLSLATIVMIISEGFKVILLVGAIANTLVSVGFILRSRDHKIIFPKKYIHISNESIEFKLGAWFKEQKITWDSITKVSDEGKSIHIHTSDRVIKMNMLHFPSSDEKRIKSTLNAIAEAKELNSQD